MRIRARWGAAFVAVVIVAGLAIAGDEPKTYDINWKDRWTAGQVVTVTKHETTDTESSMNGDKMRSDHESLDAVFVTRCDEVDAEGAPTKRTVFFKSWKKCKDYEKDESISGARVEVRGNEWTIEPGRTVGPLAKKWLDRRYAKSNADPLRKLMPPKMSVGQVWKPDSKAAAEAFSKSMDDAPFAPEGVTMEIKLLAVRGAPPDAVGDFELKFHLPIAGKLPGLPPGATVLPESSAEATGTHTGPLTTSTMLGTEHLDMTMTVIVSINAQGREVAVVTKAKAVQDTSTVAGGEIPAPAKPAEPAEPEKK